MKYFQVKIISLQLPLEWLNQGADDISAGAKNLALEIADYIAKKNGLTPSKVLPGKESAVLLIYENHNLERSLQMEIYNSLEIAVLVVNNKNKEIEYSETIQGFQFSATQPFNDVIAKGS